MAHYWLMKSEPSSFSIDDLKKKPQQTEPWDGVRNYQARNFLKTMQVNDLAFFYHSSCPSPGIVGIIKIVKRAYPDSTAFNNAHKYYDLRSKQHNPTWFCVDVKFIKKFPSLLGLKTLRNQKSLGSLPLLKKGNRLSIMPVTDVEWMTIMQLS